MEKKLNKSNVYTNHDDKYNIDDNYSPLNTNAATELTGVVSHGPGTEEDLDIYNDIFTFTSKDIVIDKEDEKKKKEDKSKKYNYKPW